MDAQRFQEACRLITQDRARSGIGTLGEKTLHAVIKHYLEPDERCHEIRVGGYIADICREGEICEIQTRQLYRLKKKLEAFLLERSVTVVYPIASGKRLIWIDEETGETTRPRRSPKRRTPHYALPELYGIRDLLSHPRLSVRLLLIQMDEYRRLNGWSQDKKRGSWCSDRIPVELSGELLLSSPEDYLQLIPPGLPPQFTSRDFARELGMTSDASRTGLNVLLSLGAVTRIGRQGNAFVYEVCALSPPDEDLF